MNQRLTLVIAVCGGAACWSAPGTPQMWDHFSAASDISDAVVQGDLERARRSGEWLSIRGGTEGVGPEAAPYVAQMREYGARVSEAVDISVAANYAGRLLESCGDCHQAHGGGPRFLGGGAPPTEGEHVGREMRRHAWAAGRLWEGLVGPSTEAWASGAIGLLDAPLQTEGLARRAADEPTLSRLETRVHELGRRAAGIANPRERAALYSELISTCAGCHTLVRRQ